MHNGYGYDGGTWWWIPMTLMMVAFWGGLIWLGVALVRRSDRSAHQAAPTPVTTATAAGPTAHAASILAERFAKGEIDIEEYTSRKAVLDAKA